MSKKLTQIESACANTILNFSYISGDYITHMKLQKLFYFSAGYHLAKENTYIAEHNFQAWPYGPVLPHLYDELKKFGDTPIMEFISFEGSNYAYNEGNIFNTIKETVEKLKNYNSWELSEQSHAKDGPWFQTYKEKGHKKDIDILLIRNYFKATCG